MPPECLRCDEARKRRTPSRLTTPHDRAPQWTRCGRSMREVSETGISCASPREGIAGAPRSSRNAKSMASSGRGERPRPGFPRNAESHPPLKGRDGARCNASGKTTHAGHPGVRCLLRERQSPLPLWESGESAEARVDPISPMPSLRACRRRRSRRRARCAPDRSRCRASWPCASGRYAHRRCAHRHRRCGPTRRPATAPG